MSAERYADLESGSTDVTRCDLSLLRTPRVCGVVVWCGVVLCFCSLCSACMPLSVPLSSALRFVSGIGRMNTGIGMVKDGDRA